MKSYNILCLGDSYTIGESVPLHESFPYQLVQMLRKKGHLFNAPEIVAKTGWTSFELMEHLEKIKLNSQYNFATLLIGVNNQYRGLSTEAFAKDFDFLLNKAIHSVDKNAKNVIVLSIPDWSVTPFAKDRNVVQIASEIDAYNGVCELIAQKYQVQYLNITDDTRQALHDETLLATDGLHYAAKSHSIWANKVSGIIEKSIDSSSKSSL